MISAVAVASGAGSLQPTRLVMFVTANVGNRTVTFGPTLNAPTVTVASTTPYVRLRLDHTPQPEYNTNFAVTYAQGTGASTRTVTVTKTAAYVSAGGVTRLEIPDVSAAAGWNNTWALQSGAQVTWLFTATGFTGGGIGIPIFVEGATALGASRAGQITP